MSLYRIDAYRAEAQVRNGSFHRRRNWRILERFVMDNEGGQESWGGRRLLYQVVSDVAGAGS
jgi:hypothetical protein